MTNPHPFNPPAGPGPLWDAFTSEPGVGVTLLDEDGVLLYANAEALRLFFETAPSDVIGKDLRQLGFPEPWVEERLALFQKLMQTHEPVLLRTVWHGQQQFSWVRMIPAETGDSGPRFLGITRRIPAGREAEFLLDSERPLIESGVIRLGQLDVLTPRELEVLTLLGQGLSIKDIAATLHRSVKTVERHREAIGIKLNQSKAVALANLARDAGLVLADANRQRV